MTDVLIVQSKVKDLVNKMDMNMAGDFADGLSASVEELVKKAAKRAKSNGRKTVRPDDL